MVYKVYKYDKLATADGRVLNGRIYFNHCCICLHDQLTEQVERVTLWHEIIHGILHNSGFRKHDEQLVSALAFGVWGVLQENPWLAGWMIDLSTLQTQLARQQKSEAKKGKKNG